jgi:hypothetical protein
MQCARYSAAVAVCALVLLQLLCLSRVQAQGHYIAGDVLTLKRAPSAYTSLTSIRRQSANWRSAHRVAQTAAGKKQCAFLCSANLREEGQKGIATMATAPQVYNTSAAHGRLQVVSAVAEQECGICVAYAVVAAAETAAAVRLQSSLGSSQLSGTHFYFCGYPNVTVAYQPSCDSAGLTIKDGLTALSRLLGQGQVPLTDGCFTFLQTTFWDPTRDCKARTPTCVDSQSARLLQRGRLTWMGLSSVWQMQKHIRQFGSIVCPITLSPSSRTTINAAPTAVYNGPGAVTWCMRVRRQNWLSQLVVPHPSYSWHSPSHVLALLILHYVQANLHHQRHVHLQACCAPCLLQQALGKTLPPSTPTRCKWWAMTMSGRHGWRATAGAVALAWVATSGSILVHLVCVMAATPLG